MSHCDPISHAQQIQPVKQLQKKEEYQSVDNKITRRENKSV